MPQTTLATGQKLRNSCDSCNLAKVKCSKARPSCTRCAAQGVQCIYGISMRAGKHRATGSNIQKPKPDSAASTRPTSRENTPQPAIKEERFQPYDNAFASMIDSMPTNGDWSSLLTDEYNPYLVPTGMDLDNNSLKQQQYSKNFGDDFGVQSQSPTDLSLDPSHLMNQNLFNSDPQPFPTYLEQRTLTGSTLNSSSQDTSRTGSPTSSCDCNQKVLQQLLDLTGVPQMPHAYDEALNRNKQTINFCHSILDDQGQHSHDISFVLTLTALIAKVITVYDSIYNPCSQNDNSNYAGLTADNLAAFHDLDMASQQIDPIAMSAPASAIPTRANNSPNFSSSANFSSATSPQNQSPFPMRLTLGTYRLDEKDEEKLRWDIFKIELSKVGNLVRAFEQKYCDATLPVDAQQQPQLKYEAKAYEDMVYYLQKRLRVSMDQPMRVMSGYT